MLQEIVMVDDYSDKGTTTTWFIVKATSIVNNSKLVRMANSASFSLIKNLTSTLLNSLLIFGFYLQNISRRN